MASPKCVSVLAQAAAGVLGGNQATSDRPLGHGKRQKVTKKNTCVSISKLYVIMGALVEGLLPTGLSCQVSFISVGKLRHWNQGQTVSKGTVAWPKLALGVVILLFQHPRFH